MQDTAAPADNPAGVNNYYRDKDRTFARFEHIQPDDNPVALRVHFSRPLTEREAEQAGEIVNYLHTMRFAEHRLPVEQIDPYTLEASIDTQLSKRSEPKQGISEMFDSLSQFFTEGTPRRKTRQYTRMVDGFGKAWSR